MLLIHLPRRAYESFILAQDSPAKVHVLAYIVGMGYYVGDISTLAVFTPPLRASFPALSLSDLKEMLLKPNVIICLITFLYFNWMQDRHHVILAELRKNPQTPNPDAQGEVQKYYYLPHGLWFEYVDTPHYFCEILIYLSLVGICEFRHWLLYLFPPVIIRTLGGLCWVS